MSNKPIINCHTHIFKGEHVPPYLAKTFVPYPLYKILSVPLILIIATKYRDFKNRKYIDPYREREWKKQKRAIYLKRSIALTLIVSILKLWITLNAIFILFNWINLNSPNSSFVKYIEKLYEWLITHSIVLNFKSIWLELLVVLIVIIFIKSGRNLLWFIFSRSYQFLMSLPGKMTKGLIERYMLLGRFAMHKGQGSIFSKLKDQYPPNTRFIVLPMDMGYMKAGKPNLKYPEQMEKLAELKEKYKNTFYPFVFIEPSANS